MSERKKSQAGASVPFTPEGEEDHAHSLVTHSRDISLEDRDHWDLLGSWESSIETLLTSLYLTRAHKCLRLKDKISQEILALWVWTIGTC